MLRAKCMKARSIRAGSNPAGSRGAVVDDQEFEKNRERRSFAILWLVKSLQ